MNTIQSIGGRRAPVTIPCVCSPPHSRQFLRILETCRTPLEDIPLPSLCTFEPSRYLSHFALQTVIKNDHFLVPRIMSFPSRMQIGLLVDERRVHIPNPWRRHRLVRRPLALV
jgi:hypothetical protein